MIEFENLVYLDVQKTGSTFVQTFLRKFLAGGQVAGYRHKPVSHRIEGKLYVISSRDPLAQYRSLYTYGCSGKGGLRNRLVKRGVGDYYDGTTAGFEKWLALVLAPETVRKYLSGADKPAVSNLVGLQSMRFLGLALPAEGRLEVGESKDKLKAALLEHGLCDIVLKAESLNEDLAALSEGEHARLFKNSEKIRKYLEKTPKKNASPTTFHIDLRALSSEITKLVQEREWLFFESLGYQPYK